MCFDSDISSLIILMILSFCHR
ncbi:hypothetical protein EC960932_1300, partial [Escherichia coli 96.0932]